MILQHHDSYRAYMAKVPMFLPGEIGGEAFRYIVGNRVSKGPALAVFYFITIVVCSGAALMVRQYFVDNIKLEEINGLPVVRVLPEGDVPVREVFRTLVSDNKVKTRIAAEGVTLAYFMPSELFLTALLTDLKRLYPPDFEKSPKDVGTLKRFFKIVINYTKIQIGIYPELDPLKRIIFVSVREVFRAPFEREGNLPSRREEISSLSC